MKIDKEALAESIKYVCVNDERCTYNGKGSCEECMEVIGGCLETYLKLIEDKNV